MLQRVVYYGVPSTIDLFREHLSRFEIKVSETRLKRLFELYSLLLKEQIQWTDIMGLFQNPFEIHIESYKDIGIRTAQRDIELLLKSGLIFGYFRRPSFLEIVNHSKIW